jgi:PKD repeat protein
MAALSLVGAACGGDDDGGPSNTPPTATFAAPTCDEPTLTCTFTDASTDADGTVESREWTFENGDPAESSEVTQVVTFTSAGPHTVTLTVTDNEGATDDVSQEVTIGTTPGNQPPTADFTVECSSVDCTFTNASADADGTFTSSWDFGDGSPASTEADPVHTYDVNELTTFTVTLTVTDDDGDTDVATQDISVSPPATLTCGTTPDCSLDIEANARVTVTLVSSDCELSGNTFKVIITPPGGGTPVEETLFTDGCNTPDGTEYQLQSNAVFAAGTTIRAEVISGGAVLELPPAVRVTDDSAYPTWTIEFDDGAQSEPPEPDFNDLIITVVATPE